MKLLKAKTLKLAVIATAMLMLPSIAALSQTSVKLELYKPGTEIARLNVSSLQADKAATVTVRDEDGAILFTDRTKEDQYIKLISFNKLNEGRYFVDLEQSTGIIRKVVVKDESGLSIKDESLYFQNFIKLADEDRKLFVRFNTNIDQPVTIRIMDSEGHILHEAANINTDNHTRLYNLSMLLHGTYNISLVSGDFVSSRTIHL
ncbi:hypothetical protein [Cesiribacter sp. SM1]|uniref:hypothetical protein n=1 Tax=Cesiribacter sp. SM1 TaxID=2861196 RepID=UPI001CD39FDF|nr:hypothetical protein [Cesiribacter sp. SM1]